MDMYVDTCVDMCVDMCKSPVVVHQLFVKSHGCRRRDTAILVYSCRCIDMVILMVMVMDMYIDMCMGMGMDM